MNPVLAIYRRELRSYFSTPIAAIFIIVFVLMASSFTFYLGNFFQTGQADLQAFFQFHPWLYLLLVPALAMQLWAEERKTGSLELLLTLPITISQAVIGKFLAAWTLIAIALILTFPMWISVSWLGNPDHGVIVASYFSSWLMAGAFLAVGSAVSAATRSQVMSFIISLGLCLALVLMGFPIMLSAMQGSLPQGLIDFVASLSFLAHFQSITRGILEFRDVLFFVIQIIAWLVACVWIVHFKKAD
jgi:ABC-2 type transport system permease protein